MRAVLLRDKVIGCLEGLKGLDIVALDVSRITDITDFMIIVSGTSNRHVKAMVDRVSSEAKEAGIPPIGVEGRDTNEWVLVDLGDVLVHVMQGQTRSIYELERLWSELPSDTESLI
ncbi:MAG: ribosome silencing factor [Gammaproteobacteria bacterium]|nr:ribosome silencing factor [Gammaproteobacteria bacterium]